MSHLLGSSFYNDHIKVPGQTVQTKLKMIKFNKLFYHRIKNVPSDRNQGNIGILASQVTRRFL
jgi:hypothetical protein